jgi:acetyl-CoA carboxylase biotin carboxyl carrier protein
VNRVTADDRSPRAGGSAAPRSADDRVADHAAIERLAEDLVPALIAKLSASGLGEIEIGEDDWTVRVRRPGGPPGENRRATDRASRAQPGHAGHGHAPGSFEGHRSARDGAARPAATAGASSSNGSGPAPEDSSSGGRRSGEPAAAAHRAIATSPAVGVFHPRSELSPGSRVRSGDRLGAVDMLGIPQEVVAPADGILGASLVESGQAVEYGQELIIIELAAKPADRGEG